MKWFDEKYGYFLSEFPRECVDDCSASGQVYPSVSHWVEELCFEVPRDKAIKWLSEFGAWTDAELNELSDCDLAEKVLWLACGDINEQGEWFGLVH